MNIKLIAIGKIKEKYLKSGIEDFTKRIQLYSTLQIVEIPAEHIFSDSEIEKILRIEGEKILRHLNNSCFFIALDIDGKVFSSEELASMIDKISLQGYNQLVFAIGGAYGLSPKVKEKADLLLSLSKMTFLHEMARLLMLEQIYRSFKIIKNEPYHK